MRIRTYTEFLIFIIVIQAVAIVSLLHGDRQYRKKYNSPKAYATHEAVRKAVFYQSPVEKFEKIVKSNTHELKVYQDQNFPDDTSVIPILAECALSGYTNYAMVILKYGGDANEAIRWIQKKEPSKRNAIALIASFSNSVGNATARPENVPTGVKFPHPPK